MIAQQPVHPGSGQTCRQHTHRRGEVQREQEKKAWQLDLEIEFRGLDQVCEGKC